MSDHVHLVSLILILYLNVLVILNYIRICYYNYIMNIANIRIATEKQISLRKNHQNERR